MPNLNKLLNKINQASQAVKSAKGIKSKLEQKKGALSQKQQQARSNAADYLKEQQEESKRNLEQRRSSLKGQFTSKNKGREIAKKKPRKVTEPLQYPLGMKDVDNYIVFEARARKSQGGRTGQILEVSENPPAIALYISSGLSSTSSVDYEATEIGSFARDAASAMGRGEEGFSLDTLASTIENQLQSLMANMNNAMAGGVVNAIAGRAANPMEEQMLKGVQFRTFTFEYDFYPHSPEEANMINDIIFTFRALSLPDTFGMAENAANENFFNYPNIFDVYFEGPVADRIDGFLPMVCTAVNVDHFGGGEVAYYRDGQPVKTSVSLEFAEIKILTQETYSQISPMSKQILAGGSPSLIDRNTGGNSDPRDREGRNSVFGRTESDSGVTKRGQP